MSHPSRRLASTCLGAVTAIVLLAGAAIATPGSPQGVPRTWHPDPSEGVPWGAFLGSGPEGVERIAGMEHWLGGTELRVGHTYLPGNHWTDIEGDLRLLQAWADWRREDPGRLLVLNVPMLDRNEHGIPDAEVAALLERGAQGDFDEHFRTLASRLVALGVPDTVIVLGWEMNGTTYTGRCAPDPEAWKAYWMGIVTTMRSVPGQRFRFDFAPSRGKDAIGWTECYPGDDVVDIIGMDSYDQPPGKSFDEQVEQPFGLRAQVEFAERHNKPTSYPEWGLFRYGDNPRYMRRMLQWISENPPEYHTITDYCPHGVWRCAENPRASRVFRALQHSRPRRHQPGTEADCLPLDLGPLLEPFFGQRRLCIRFSWRDT
ncbi:glycoside hydrolase family 26 protein [Streptomyces sp. 8N706]|uniref:glycoside hydrolase family 26 protein n=1 Tax=Streptomyces sp. 8N706 TaxID=3457416 RepID=UPI003FCF1BCB